MPRKKSAAKKAREAAKKEVIEDKNDVAVDVQEPNQEQEPKQKKEDNQEDEDIGDDDDEESSEEEDDFGELLTEEVEDGIKNVLNAIRNNEKDKLLDPKVRFFEDPEVAASKLTVEEKHKPVYLKDYHRMNILSGDALKDDDEHDDFDMPMETVDGKQSFVSQQREERQQLLDEINSAFKEDGEEEAEAGSRSGSESEGDDDDGFLKKKAKKEDGKGKADDPLKNINPDKDEEKFLDEFVNQHAWIPKKGDKIIQLDGETNIEEDDEEFEDAVEKFENAYNFRYEDPTAAEIVSYARNQATLRRSATSTRRRKRDEEKAQREEEQKKKEESIQKKKTKKVNKVTDILEQIKEAYGAEISEEMVQKITDTLLNNDYKEDDWNDVVAQLFNDEFYSQEGKPNWDEDDEIMADFYNGKEDNDDEEVEEAENDEEIKPKKKEKKDEKKSKKKEKKQLTEMVEKAVDKNKLAIIDEVEEERGRSREKEELKFRYREVSPESFGLSVREIMAADDVDLNEFIGLKKFAPYRAKELRAKDKRKVTKSRRLREWRKKVFNNEEGLTEEEFIAKLEKEDKNSSDAQSHSHKRKHEGGKKSKDSHKKKKQKK
ncbi:Protein KRI1 [Nakaseomyces bracarensis]|uniref:Protein KRI1 n=1 Tax=Nakaseomyces bracarensis TaxID=273131 RepID=A0ABR4NWM1_9SACH